MTLFLILVDYPKIISVVRKEFKVWEMRCKNRLNWQIFNELLVRNCIIRMFNFFQINFSASGCPLASKYKLQRHLFTGIEDNIDIAAALKMEPCV